MGTTVDEFIESVKSGNSSFVADFNRDIPNIVENKYFSPDSVNAKALGETDAITGPKYIYEISVSEIEPTEAVKKARILALAGSRVAKEFFDGYKTNLNELIKDIEVLIDEETRKGEGLNSKNADIRQIFVELQNIVDDMKNAL